MSIAEKSGEFGDPRNAFSAVAFRKALKGFETGDLKYSEVRLELKRLLAGVSRRELHQVLRSSESIEPLPEYAYREVRRFLDEAIEQDVAPQTDPNDVREQEVELGAAELTAELQKSREALELERTRVRETEEALSERIVAEEAVRSRLGIALHESERHQAELRSARNSIASRDKLTAQIRQSLDERDVQLAAVRREHAELAAASDLRAADAATELAASRETVNNERRERQEIERALTQSDLLNSAARESLASKEKALAGIHQILDERDVLLTAIRRENAELTAALDLHFASGVQLNAELQVLRGQAADAAAELAAAREALDHERRKRQEIERALINSDSLNSDSRAALTSKDKALAEKRQMLDERDAQLAAIVADAAAELAASRDVADKERSKRQDIERALTESDSLNRAARDSLASNEKALAEKRQMLDERDAQLAAMRREHAELAAALDLRSATGEQSNAELQVLRGKATDAATELAASREALDNERRKRQEVERTLTESNSLNSAARESLASKDETLAEMRQSIGERDAQLAAQQVEFQAALQTSEEKLQAEHGRVLGANADRDGLRSEVTNLQAQLRDNNALIEKLYASVRSESERATQWQGVAQQRESEAIVTSARVAAMPEVQVLPRARTAQAYVRTTPRQIWIGAAMVSLATVIWFAAHRPSSIKSSPDVSSAAMTQPPTTPPATESAEPLSVSAENVSAPEAPTHAAATPAAAKSVTVATTLNTDFRRCRAGGIDACYDAIRYRPSDPSLLSALGDALLRANRPADALRAYQRVAILAPNMPGVVAKISALEAKLSAKRASVGGTTHPADVMRNSNAAPHAQTR